jgi:hypothetical protein
LQYLDWLNGDILLGLLMHQCCSISWCACQGWQRGEKVGCEASCREQADYLGVASSLSSSVPAEVVVGQHYQSQNSTNFGSVHGPRDIDVKGGQPLIAQEGHVVNGTSFCRCAVASKLSR